MQIHRTRRVVMVLAAALAGWLAPRTMGDCTLPNPPFTPLNDLGTGTYKNFPGGLYPNGSNTRPPAHDAAGRDIALNQIKPLDAAGNPDPTNGKIVLLSLGMSHTTQEFASGDIVTHDPANAFKYRADNDPAKNPQVVIVDGAQGGMAATTWTNANATTWSNVIAQRLTPAGVTTNQVQVMWLKQALPSPQNFGAFPLHAQSLQNDLAIILRLAKVKYPNLKLVFLSGRSHAWVNGPPGLNPEPFAYETAFADKWVIEDQILGRPNLNYDPANGPVKAPWIAWGPYQWAAGTNPRSDGFVWNCDDVRQDDFTHPSSHGVYKVASHLLAFFKTDPTTTPWFLRTTLTPPALSIAASTTNGLAPLAVNFAATASSSLGAVTNYCWTFDDGGFSLEQNPTKVFPAPGSYNVHLTAEDTQGNTALTSLVINVSPPPFQVTAIAKQGNDVTITWATRGGESYVVQSAATLDGNLSPRFTNLSPVIAAPAAAVSLTNYVDVGAVNAPARFYRISLP